MNPVKWLFKRPSANHYTVTDLDVDAATFSVSFGHAPGLDANGRDRMRKEINAALEDWLRQFSFDVGWSPQNGVTWVTPHDKRRNKGVSS